LDVLYLRYVIFFDFEMKLIHFGFISICLVLCTLASKAQDPLTISQKMFETVKSFKTLQYSFELKERYYGKIIHEKSNFKIQINPLKIYLYQSFPNNGVECIFVSGKNENKLKVNPNSFPYVNLNLAPEGSLVLEKHHHTIFDGGFVYTTSIIEYLLNKYKSQSTKLITNNGIVNVNGSDCYYLTFVNPGYRLTTYMVKENETPLSIAKKLQINYYSILDNNPSVKGIGKIKPGTVIIVPNDYASKMELYIHKEKYYPVQLKIYDHKGLYEDYSFLNVIINPKFTDKDFSEDNPAYHF
jgi:outer membrane lipoprotein-sorting protein